MRISIVEKCSVNAQQLTSIDAIKSVAIDCVNAPISGNGITTSMKRAIKIIMIFLTVILSGLTIIFIITFIKRLTLPYNSEGRYFDESSMVVYHDDGIIAYGLLAFAFTVLTLFIGYVAKKLSIK